MKKNLNSKHLLYLIVLIALFSALSFLATFIAIPVGISKVHLGNYIAIVSGMLLGPLSGGISASIGMGLNDILSGYGPDTIIRTFLVKFAIGYLSGLFLRFFLKRNKEVKIEFLILTVLFLILFFVFLILYINYGESFKFIGYTFKNSLFLVISLGVFTLLQLFSLIFSIKIEKKQRIILLVSTIVSSINIILEFIIKIPMKMLIANLTFEQAYAYAITSLPSAIITTIVTVIFVTFTFLPIYFSTKRINKVNDLSDYL